MKIDDYLFEPCGYSMNGILRNESNDYGLVRTRMNYDTGCFKLTLLENLEKVFIFNWGHVCVSCSDGGSFANPHLENFNSWI